MRMRTQDPSFRHEGPPAFPLHPQQTRARDLQQVLGPSEGGHGGWRLLAVGGLQNSSSGQLLTTPSTHRGSSAPSDQFWPASEWRVIRNVGMPGRHPVRTSGTLASHIFTVTPTTLAGTVTAAGGLEPTAWHSLSAGPRASARVPAGPGMLRGPGFLLAEGGSRGWQPQLLSSGANWPWGEPRGSGCPGRGMPAPTPDLWVTNNPAAPMRCRHWSRVRMPVSHDALRA